MCPMGWEALEQWGDDVALIEPLAGGVANDVWTVRVNGHLAVGRLGVRSDADLAWETELLERLDREGLTVPVPIPTTDGRLFADGLVVMTYVRHGPYYPDPAPCPPPEGFRVVYKIKLNAFGWCPSATQSLVHTFTNPDYIG